MTIAFLLTIWTKFLAQVLTKIYPKRGVTIQMGFKLSCLLVVLMAKTTIATSNEVAYDCAAGTQSITTISTDDVTACPPFQKSYVNAPRTTIQVIQKTTNTLIQSYRCKYWIGKRVDGKLNFSNTLVTLITVQDIFSLCQQFPPQDNI